MIVIVKKSFLKDLKRIKEKDILQKVIKVFSIAEKLTTDELKDIYNIKKMKNSNNYYRIRFGDYRIGISLIDNQITFIRIKHRKDIYNIFP